MSEEAKITIEEARALVADAALWPRVRDFLWDFAPQVHASWLKGLETSSSPRIKKYILGTLGVEPCFHTFPRDDWSRLLLLDGATLEAIVKWLGAIVMADELRRVADGKTVRGLKAALPGIYPDVFAYGMYFSGFDLSRKEGSRGGAEAQGSEGSAAQGVLSAGLSVVEPMLAPLPKPLVARFRFKLPEGLCSSVSLRLKPAERGKMVSKLLKLKFPEAYSLCC